MTETYRLPLASVVTLDTRSRADVMANSAAALCTGQYGYSHMGRGPDAFDDVGLVLACAQAALDWSRAGAAPDVLLGDLEEYPEEPGQISSRITKLVEGWGLRRVGAASHINVSKEARRGDILAYVGRGPAVGVVVDAWIRTPTVPHFSPPAVATVWREKAPRVARQSVMSWTPLNLFRWPDQPALADEADRNLAGAVR